ncbi:type II toxin-antitoxin system PemK/MazF family toxin [Halarcobacter sp.]|uniref:type II toxin-antitoxin system PemK/MazF family toxin n=1 Tax=Halarcobacter sp. TaxID=2321133 RepID=UPI0029F50586|nr:type II toxin-antitoxin system PemK/MazF family toxin [Halarcobacter sp.]
MIENDFDKWNEIKKRTQDKKITAYFREREIYWANIGKNIGYEQNGKGKDFMRPLLILRKYNNKLFCGIPLSTTIREGSFFYNFNFLENKDSCALLVQAKTFDVKRLDRKIGTINKNDFEKLEIKFKKLMKL